MNSYGMETTPARQYWQESARPLSSLVFVIPMLLVYELGIIWQGPAAMRNGADVWLRTLLDMLGFGQYILLPLLTCGILLAWHHISQSPWRVSPAVVVTMLPESLFFGGLLLLAAHLQAAWFVRLEWPVAATMADLGVLEQLVGYFGAGIYEELLFRLMLLPITAYLLRWAGESTSDSWLTAAVLTSLVFSAAHYQLFTGHGDVFSWYSFFFRTLAGLFFATLFLVRGFGIAAGAHTAYDVMAGMFNAIVGP